ncbi:hypothetical protein ACFXPY_12355 [Streptomyces sp. NPDC059153]|uniref:hypothetical protein n=1 Tax=Streptomyces sp. NPDC059153 TaxID=3346743 RepID=UPI0036CA0BFF
MAAGGEHEAAGDPVPDVQDPALAVDHDGAARDVPRQRRPGGHVNGSVQGGEESGQGATLAWMAAEVRLDGLADRGGTGGHERRLAFDVGAECCGAGLVEVAWVGQLAAS